MPYAIINTGSKQFFVEEGRTIRVPSIAAEAGNTVELNALLAEADGAPVVGAAKVSATVVSHGRGTKLLVFKKKRRKHYKRTQGHRQGFTTIRIDSIG